MKNSSLRLRLSTFVTHRSSVRFRNFPTRRNTLRALVVLVGVVPIASLVFVILVVRSFFQPKLRVMVLAVDGEFGGFVSLMECFRHDIECGDHFDYVLVLSPWRHQTLQELYRVETGARIFWGGGLSGLLQQALILQPKSLVFFTERANWNHFLRDVQFPKRCISPSSSLVDLRRRLLRDLELPSESYVLMSVYTMEYEEERNPRFRENVRLLETVGDELVLGVDYLVKQNLGVILLGSPDTGRSRIPREISRLSEFGRLGGPEEVALASGCEYFWTDNVGAWWLAAPFGRPVLHTNFQVKQTRLPISGYDLFVPRRYQTLDGRLLTLSELLYMEGSPYKAALRGELKLIRNSPEEILEAQQEMLSTIYGEWKETESMKSRRQRVESIYSNYHSVDLLPLRIPAAFLERHEYLLS